MPEPQPSANSRTPSDTADRSPSSAPRTPGRAASSAAERLRSLVLPVIRRMELPLRAARHKTLLDDRLDAQEPCIRFRLIPRYGAFDDPPAVAGSVLELGLADGALIVSIWLDPLADEPSRRFEVDAAEVGEGWIEGVLVDFVARSLRAV